MKRYEDFNKALGGNETAEEQACGMIIATIADKYKLAIDADSYVKFFKARLEWLNEEVGEGRICKEAQ